MADPSGPSRDAAFVVHLADTADEQAHGRVEHVCSGRVSRFDSAEELVCFMRRTLAELGAGKDEE